MKSHKKEAVEYGKLKELLAFQFSKDIEGYSDGKENFIKNLERRAIDWKQKNKR